jgi:hypothetical protein
MKAVVKALIFAGLMFPSLAADARGLKPRPDPADYPAEAALADGASPGASLGAAILTPLEVS